MSSITKRCFLRLTLLFCAVACCSAAFCVPANAQEKKTVTLRMIDSRTGVLIASNSYLVRMNHQTAEHGDWVVKNEDGAGVLTLPAEAEEIAVNATYDYGMTRYVNCDADKDRGSSEHSAGLDHWYTVAKILSDGIVAPNNCVGKKVPERLQVVAKPGEFVFFVRKLKAGEDFRD